MDIRNITYLGVPTLQKMAQMLTFGRPPAFLDPPGQPFIMGGGPAPPHGVAPVHIAGVIMAESDKSAADGPASDDATRNGAPIAMQAGRGDGDATMAQREKVHIVEHKRFNNDTRRHFVGEVEAFDATHIRVHGYPFVYDSQRGKFVRVEPMRTCVFATDNNIGITILPPDFDIETARYSRSGGDFVFDDARQHSFEIGAYTNVA